MVKHMSHLEEKMFSDFYRQDSQGNRLFFPWGSMGDSFVLNDTQDAYIGRALRLFVLAACYVIAALFLYCELNAAGIFQYNWIVSLGVSVFMAAYFLYMCRLAQKIGLKPAYQRVEHDKLHMKLLKVTLVQFMILGLGLLYHPYDFMLWMSALAVVCLNSFFIVLAWHKEARFITP